MNFCFTGFKSGTICTGDAMAQLHGEVGGLGQAGLGMMGMIFVVAMVYVFRKTA